MKKCNVCGQVKPESDFYSIHVHKCKSCMNRIQSEKIYVKNLNLYPDLEGEIWKWVVGYEGLYRISNYARVRSEVYGGRRGKILNQRKGTGGYNLMLVKDGVRKVFRVSTLVAEAFLFRPGEKYRLIHIDGNKLNSKLENLRYESNEVLMTQKHTIYRNMPRVKHLYEIKGDKNMFIPEINSKEWLSLDNLEGEIWRDIEELDGLYQISNYGRVKSLERIVNKHLIREKILRISFVLGYCKVTIHQKQYSVHRLVAKAFLENPSNLPFVNHKDENPKNNYVLNLEWCDCKYNLNYGNCKAKMSRARFVNPTNTEPTVCFNKEQFIVAIFSSQMDASRSLGISLHTINKICNHSSRMKKVRGFWFRKLSEVRDKIDFYNKNISCSSIV